MRQSPGALGTAGENSFYMKRSSVVGRGMDTHLKSQRLYDVPNA